MAAGLSSRFGVLKQLTPVGPNFEFIMDYSIYDAIKAGFTKVVFVIRKDFYNDFKNTIGKRLEGKIKVEYVFQELNDLPDGYKCPLGRVKPFGVGAAIYSLKNIDGPFAVINADDFYGFEALCILFSFLKKNQCFVLGYKLENVLSKNGSVRRGIIDLDGDNLLNINEYEVLPFNDGILGKKIGDNMYFKMPLDTLASMNAYVFTLKFKKMIVDNFSLFLKDNINDLDKEYFINDVINKEIRFGNICFKVKKTDFKWCGVTYKEDKDDMVLMIEKLIEKGEYPKKLF